MQRDQPAVLLGQVTFANGTFFLPPAGCDTTCRPWAIFRGNGRRFLLSALRRAPRQTRRWGASVRLFVVQCANHVLSLSLVSIYPVLELPRLGSSPWAVSHSLPAEKEKLKAPSSGESVASSVRSDGTAPESPAWASCSSMRTYDFVTFRVYCIGNSRLRELPRFRCFSDFASRSSMPSLMSPGGLRSAACLLSSSKHSSFAR